MFTEPSLLLNKTIFELISKPFNANSVSICLLNALARSIGVSSTRPSSMKVIFTCATSSTIFDCGDSTATPLFLATLLTATSVILLSSDASGKSPSSLSSPIVCLRKLDAADVFPSLGFKCDGKSELTCESKLLAVSFICNHLFLCSSLISFSASIIRSTNSSVGLDDGDSPIFEVIGTIVGPEFVGTCDNAGPPIRFFSFGIDLDAI
ncbi:MAG: Uncharacterised protein [Methanobacteriota archaeon]|nr:MAG: Uncharacterised protein [Euryarchaeota archaeon]